MTLLNGTYRVGDMTWMSSSNGWGPAERNRANGEQAAPAAVHLHVTGRSTLRLVVSDGGNGNSYDHADWAGARLVC